MTLTFSKADVLKKLKALRTKDQASLGRTHAKLVASYQSEQKAYVARTLAYYNKAVAGEAPALEYSEFRGLRKPPKNPTESTKYNAAIDLLELCTEDEIKLDTHRDKYGLARVLLQALQVDES